MRPSPALVTRARHPVLLLAIVVLVSGLLSAFLVNDTICLVLTPLVLDVVRRLRRDPVPYLLAIAMASNVGSTATITGNPQNIIIGSFLGSLRPFRRGAGAGCRGRAGADRAADRALWPREFWTRERLFADPPPVRLHRSWPARRCCVTAAMVVAFFAGVPPPKAALVGGAVLLLTRR